MNTRPNSSFQLFFFERLILSNIIEYKTLLSMESF